MFTIKYETWEAVCNMYFEQKQYRLKAYIQWFPFSKLSSDDKATIRSEEFYYKYIQSGSVVLFPASLLRTDNHIQKSDGSFRSSSLLSPISYLILQSIGKTISNVYKTVFCKYFLEKVAKHFSIVLQLHFP